MKAAGPPGASSNGFNENLALFNAGKCAMWIDATVAASFVTNPKDSKVADKVGFALAPNAGLGKNANWLWAWNLAIPAGSKKVEAAEKFIAWATSKDYTKLVASKEGWANVPPGHAHLALSESRISEGRAVRQADAGLDRCGRSEQADGASRCLMSGCNTRRSRNSRASAPRSASNFSAALSGSSTVDAALAAAQSSTEREMKRAGYIK